MKLNRLKMDPKRTRYRERQLRIHYHNPNMQSRYAQLHMWAWSAFKTERDIAVDEIDDFGALFVIPRQDITSLRKRKQRLGFRFKDRHGLQDAQWFDIDRWWHPSMGWDIYITHDSEVIYGSAEDAFSPDILAAYLDSDRRIEVHFRHPPKCQNEEELAAAYQLSSGTPIFSVRILSPKCHELTTEYIDLKQTQDLVFQSHLGPVQAGLYPRGIMGDYEPIDAKLGCWVDGERTHFRLWAPRATAVQLHLSDLSEGASDSILTMYEEGKGLWFGTVAADLHGSYYWFHVAGPQGLGDRFDLTQAVNDPYARAVISDDKDQSGRGIVVRGPSVEKQPLKQPIQRSDLVISELHVRDFSYGQSGGFKSSQGYLDWTQSGTQSQLGSATGLDHLKELGINAVQLLPVQAFPWPRHQYNWGYFTANFFAPMGSYSSNERSTARIDEFQRMVNALHRAGIAVILDVVFNHTAEGDHFGPTFNLRGLDSKYYYRQDPQTFHFYNGSGVGNELASERPMARKLIVDCCKYWVEQFGVDGFRFDLMALMDLETLDAIADALPEHIHLYGEPWSAGRTLWGREAIRERPRYAAFNDAYRDAIKGSPEGQGWGFIQGAGNLAEVKAALTANTQSFAGEEALNHDANDGIQYLTCHDNLTLNDKLEVSVPDMDDGEKQARASLAAVLHMTSPGPILLHGGMEFLRSKPFVSGFDGRSIKSLLTGQALDGNSYKAPAKVNAIDWRRKDQYRGLFHFYKRLIALRLSPEGSALRCAQKPRIDFFEDSHNPRALAYHIHALERGSDHWIALNADKNRSANFSVHSGCWQVMLYDGRFLPGQRIPGPGQITVPPLSALILRKENQATPGRHPLWWAEAGEN